MNLRLVKSASAALYGAATLGMVDVLTGSIDLGSSTYSIGDQAPIVAFLAVVIAAGIHGPRLKQMGLWELTLGAAALLLPVATYSGRPSRSSTSGEPPHNITRGRASRWPDSPTAASG